MKNIKDSDKNLTINALDINGNTLLHKACIEGAKEKIRLLLELGANREALNNEGRTPKQCLDFGNDLFHEICLILDTTEYYDLKEKDKKGNTLLHKACVEGNVNKIKLLLERGADTIAKNNRGEVPLHCLPSNLEAKSYTEIIKIFVKTNGFDINKQDQEGNTLLHKACANRSSGIPILLQQGANPNVLNNKNEMPLDLFHSGGSWDIEIFKMFLENGFYINARGDKGKTFLHKSCEKDYVKGDLTFLKFLLKNKADVYVKDECNEMPLDLVDTTYDIWGDIVEDFVKIGKFDVNTKDKDGSTLMHKACDREGLSKDSFRISSIFTVKFLLSKSANINVENQSNNTPLHIVCKKNDLELLKMLLAKSSVCKESLSLLNTYPKIWTKYFESYFKSIFSEANAEFAKLAFTFMALIKFSEKANLKQIFPKPIIKKILDYLSYQEEFVKNKICEKFPISSNEQKTNLNEIIEKIFHSETTTEKEPAQKNLIEFLSGEQFTDVE